MLSIMLLQLSHTLTPSPSIDQHNHEWCNTVAMSRMPAGIPLFFADLSLVVRPQDLATAVAWLSSQTWVTWVSPVPQVFLHNAFASAVSQSGGLPPSWMASGGDPRNPALRPFWKAGLDGTGQVGRIG